MERIRFFAVIGEFLETYGFGFFTLVLVGAIIAGLVEVIIKMSCKWLETKWAGHDRLLALLDGIRIVLTQTVTWTLSVWFAKLVMEAMTLPGGDHLLPIWVSLVYFLQFLFSCVGLKGLKALIKAHKARKEAEAQEEPEPEVLTPTEYPGVFKNASGQLVKRNGKPIRL